MSPAAPLILAGEQLEDHAEDELEPIDDDTFAEANERMGREGAEHEQAADDDAAKNQVSSPLVAGIHLAGSYQDFSMSRSDTMRHCMMNLHLQPTCVCHTYVILSI